VGAWRPSNAGRQALLDNDGFLDASQVPHRALEPRRVGQAPGEVEMDGRSITIPWDAMKAADHPPAALAS
jgi:hypothetical protein